MTLAHWSLPKLLVVAVAWVVGFPLLLLAALVLGLGNVQPTNAGRAWLLRRP
jgi:hypothetical protein